MQITCRSLSSVLIWFWITEPLELHGCPDVRHLKSFHIDCCSINFGVQKVHIGREFGMECTEVYSLFVTALHGGVFKCLKGGSSEQEDLRSFR